MIDRFRDFACVWLSVLLLAVTGATAQTTQSPISPTSAAPQAVSPPTVQGGAQQAGPKGPQVNVAEITARANRDVGVDIEATTAGWQHELERLEGELRGPHLRYSELNALRDE